jgi:glycosyltransferase involved in cell wall biosynthesis
MPPFVSVIVPCYNEELTIRHLLEALNAQTYPHHLIEVVISDGLSTDRTAEVISAWQMDHPALAIRVEKNTARTIPSGLNQAIRLARGEIFIRMDAHSVPIPEYVERCVAALESGKGENVGGVWEIHPGAGTWIAESISVAAAHPLGVGDAMYRLKAQAGPVDTVPFGSFRRALIDKIGMFDETLLANEDYEFNARVRASGGIVWIDPAIRSIYFARSTLAQLAQQYWRYGYWKWRMLRRYPYTLRWRQALPPLFVLSLGALFVLSLLVGHARVLLSAQLLLYFATLFASGLKAASDRRKPFLVIGLPLVIATMHMTWGAGFLWSMLSSPLSNHG